MKHPKNGNLKTKRLYDFKKCQKYALETYKYETLIAILNYKL